MSERRLRGEAGVAPLDPGLAPQLGDPMTQLFRTVMHEAVPAASADSPVSMDPPTIARFKHLTETLLPDLARRRRWPIRLDHCFKRICLDHAFEDIWYRHLPRPAERHLAGNPLARAVACAETIVRDGLLALTTYNAASLAYRGKLWRERTR